MAGGGDGGGSGAKAIDRVVVATVEEGRAAVKMEVRRTVEDEGEGGGDGINCKTGKGGHELVLAEARVEAPSRAAQRRRRRGAEGATTPPTWVVGLGEAAEEAMEPRTSSSPSTRWTAQRRAGGRSSEDDGGGAQVRSLRAFVLLVAGEGGGGEGGGEGGGVGPAVAACTPAPDWYQARSSALQRRRFSI